MAQQCPPFALTFSSRDIFSTELRDGNSYVHYVTCTQPSPTKDTPSSPLRTGRRNSKAFPPRPSLLRRRSIVRNPTIIVRPKSTSSEAKIVASLKWEHWADSIFSTRWQVVRLEKILPMHDHDERDLRHSSEFDSESNLVREFPTTKGTWRWFSCPEGGLQLLDACNKLVARYNDRALDDDGDDAHPQLRVEFKALDLLDLIVCSLLVAVHDLQQNERDRQLTALGSSGSGGSVDMNVENRA